MKTKYLLVDDEPSAASYAATLAAAHKDLEIDLNSESDPDRIESLIKRKKPNGLIIDLELTKSKGNTAEHFKIGGTALTQEFRTRSKNTPVLEIPMVNLSYASRRIAIIGEDTTSTDLFDANLSKKEVKDDSTQYAKLLVDLAKGYGSLRKLVPFTQERWPKVLGLSALDYDRVDNRVQLELTVMSGRPVHNVAGFFLHSFLPFSGPLIEESTLAVRLGIDRERSRNAWHKLLSKLPNKARYKGVFSSSHSRWWMMHIDDWWQSLKGGPAPLTMLPVLERISILRKQFQLRNLVAIEGSKKSTGTRYWATCERTGEPIDPSEGYAIIDDERMHPWHDKRYLSRQAAMTYIQFYKFETGEKARLKKISRYSTS